MNIRESNHILPFLWMRGEPEEVIREEMARVHECGIGAVCVESRPHPDFAGPLWWRDLDIVMDEARKRGMRVWVLDDAHFPTGYANGYIEKKYPHRKKTYLNYNIADVWGASHEVTIHVAKMLKPNFTWLDIGKPRDVEEQKNNKLVAVVAAELVSDSRISERSIMDLTDLVAGEFLTVRLPPGNWRVFVIYETKTDGGNPAYINMLDRESVSTLLEAVYEPHYERYAQDFGQTFAGFFSDEPSFGNVSGFQFDEIIGRKEMPLPWSEEARQLMIEALGEKWYIHLPYLWTDSVEMQRCVHSRHTYMDIVTRLYERNFSRQLGEWCQARGVEYIGHVIEDNNVHARLGSGAGHYFRAMAGQHMAGIDVIGGQVIKSGPRLERVWVVKGDGEFYHYALGKLGSSCGHLDPAKKGRTMCELYGAYGWKLGVRDMKYILDHLLVRGVNYLVPHAFSMKVYPDHDCPPHFYARGHNPQFRHFARLMRYANRMCSLLDGGVHVAPVAVLYHAESEWSGSCMLMQKPARELTEHQIDYDFVSIDMLRDLAALGGGVADGELRINGETFRCLVIPYSEYVTRELAAFIRMAAQAGLRIVFVNGLPKGIANEPDEGIAGELLAAIQSCEVAQLDDLAARLKAEGIYDVHLHQPFRDLTYYRYVKDGRQIFMLMNESALEAFHGEITLPIAGSALIYHAWEDRFERLAVRQEHGRGVIRLELAPAESCIIMECGVEEADQYAPYVPASDRLQACEGKLDLSAGWRYSLTDSKSYPAFGEQREMENLVPISRIDPTFTGFIRYEKSFELVQVPAEAILSMEAVYEAAEVWVNDQYAGTRISAPYSLDVSRFLTEGRNTLRIEVATTLDRDRLRLPEPPFTFVHEPMDPTGMFGRIVLHTRQP